MLVQPAPSHRFHSRKSNIPPFPAVESQTKGNVRSNEEKHTPVSARNRKLVEGGGKRNPWLSAEGSSHIFEGLNRINSRRARNPLMDLDYVSDATRATRSRRSSEPHPRGCCTIYRDNNCIVVSAFESHQPPLSRGMTLSSEQNSFVLRKKRIIASRKRKSILTFESENLLLLEKGFTRKRECLIK